MSIRTVQKAKEVYRGYMPLNLPQHRPPNRIKPWWKVEGKPRVTLYPKQRIEGYSEEAEYPPLNDGSRKGVRDQIRLDWYESLKSIPTAEEKMYEIGRHCRHYTAMINNWLPTYDSLPMAQYLTQTVLIDSLPDNYKRALTVSDEDEKSQELIDKVKDAVLNQLALDKFDAVKTKPGTLFMPRSARDRNRNGYVSNVMIQSLVSSIKKLLILETNPQLLEYQYDRSPSVRSWWLHSGLQAPNNKVFYKSRKDKDGNVNQIVQMDGSTALNIRGEHFIEPIISQTDSLVTDTSLVPKHCFSPRHYGTTYKFKYPVALPGFWFEETSRYEFPHTSFLSTDCLNLRNACLAKVVKPLDDSENALTGQAILTAYGWLNSLSMYHGYTIFQELDYPFTSQVITTDGQNWLFNIYQLNCHTFHRDLGGPMKNNICWSSGMMKLYESYENGKFLGVNDDVIKLVIRFLSQRTSPEYTSQLELRRYLSEDFRADEEKEQTKLLLKSQFTQRCNRVELAKFRVPLWEHIFFRSKEGRYRVRHMAPQWHIPKRLPPKIFE